MATILSPQPFDPRMHRSVVNLEPPCANQPSRHLFCFQLSGVQDVRCDGGLVDMFLPKQFSVTFHVPTLNEPWIRVPTDNLPTMRRGADHVISSSKTALTGANKLYYSNFGREELSISCVDMPAHIRVAVWVNQGILWAKGNAQCIGFASLPIDMIRAREGRGEITLPVFKDGFPMYGGEPSAIVTMFSNIRTIPPAPRALNVVDITQDSMRLVWQPPPHAGGGTLTQYRVFIAIMDEGEVEPPPASFIEVTDVGTNPRNMTHLITCLKGNTQYMVRVFAVNEVGSGSQCATIRARTGPMPADAPSKPRCVHVPKTHDSVELEWDAPRNVGGSEILGYRLYMEKATGALFWGSSSGWVDMGTMAVSPVDVQGEVVQKLKYGGYGGPLAPLFGTTVADLTPGCSYRFKVTAINPAGPGHFSEPSEWIKL